MLFSLSKLRHSSQQVDKEEGNLPAALSDEGKAACKDKLRYLRYFRLITHRKKSGEDEGYCKLSLTPPGSGISDDGLDLLPLRQASRKRKLEEDERQSKLMLLGALGLAKLTEDARSGEGKKCLTYLATHSHSGPFSFGSQ